MEQVNSVATGDVGVSPAANAYSYFFTHQMLYSPRLFAESKNKSYLCCGNIFFHNSKYNYHGKIFGYRHCHTTCFQKERGRDIEGIDLSVDGKILIECTNGLFEYFASLLREKYKNHSLSKTLHVTISG